MKKIKKHQLDSNIKNVSYVRERISLLCELQDTIEKCYLSDGIQLSNTRQNQGDRYIGYMHISTDARYKHISSMPHLGLKFDYSSSYLEFKIMNIKYREHIGKIMTKILLMVSFNRTGISVENTVLTWDNIYKIKIDKLEDFIDLLNRDFKVYLDSNKYNL